MQNNKRILKANQFSEYISFDYPNESGMSSRKIADALNLESNNTSR